MSLDLDGPEAGGPSVEVQPTSVPSVPDREATEPNPDDPTSVASAARDRVASLAAGVFGREWSGPMPLPFSSTPVATAVAVQGMRSLEQDLSAIQLWVMARTEEGDDGEGPEAAGATRSHTASCYRREARRYLIWLREVRERDLAGARLEDLLLYRAFLADPQPRERWCGPKGAPRGSEAWRPFEGPLSPRSRRQALVVLKSMYRFLQDQRYLLVNPLTGVAMPRGSRPRIDPGRSLTEAQLAMVLQAGARPSSPALEQLVWAVKFLHRTGLRLAELVGACVGDLRFVEIDGGDVAMPDQAADTVAPRPAERSGVNGAWVVRVHGKGGKERDVPVATDLVEALGTLVRRRGSTPAQAAVIPLLVSWRRDVQQRWRGEGALSAQAFHRQLKRLAAHAADQARSAGRDFDARAIEAASTHWLRHTHGRAAVAAGVPLDVVAHNLGHASLATTTIYTRPELARRIEQTARLTSPGR